MAAEDQVTLGIGSAPASIAPFILFGLSVSAIAAMSATPISGGGLYAPTISGTGKSHAGTGLYDTGYSYDQSADYDSGGPDGLSGTGRNDDAISGSGRV